MVNLFVSYCQKDGQYADDIDAYFKDKSITIHRDIRDISIWKSIREFMKSIREMDYAILIITENYLKSFNCMFEVLEVMKERDYYNKLFPLVIDKKIYSATGRIEYITYWQDAFKQLKAEMTKIDDVLNAGSIIDDLKRTQNITQNIDEFLSAVADMNNPNESDIHAAIEKRLEENGFEVDSGDNKDTVITNSDLFLQLDIPRIYANAEPTDYDKNQFMSNQFILINSLLNGICKQFESENSIFKIEIMELDSRTTIYEFYKNGNHVRTIKLFLGSSFGGKDINIGISCERHTFGSNNSFNGLFSPKYENGQLLLYSSFSMSMRQNTMTAEEVVREIWLSYIHPYIEN